MYTMCQARCAARRLHAGLPPHAHRYAQFEDDQRSNGCRFRSSAPPRPFARPRAACAPPRICPSTASTASACAELVEAPRNALDAAQRARRRRECGGAPARRQLRPSPALPLVAGQRRQRRLCHVRAAARAAGHQQLSAVRRQRNERRQLHAADAPACPPAKHHAGGGAALGCHRSAARALVGLGARPRRVSQA